MPSKLAIYNNRVLQVLEEMKSDMSQKEAYEKIGCNPRNATKYRNGENSFTVEQILAICKETGVSADWILGISTEKYRATAKPVDPIKALERAVSQLKGG